MNSFPNLEPICCSMCSSNCCFLTLIKISQEAGKVVWYSHLFKNFLQFPREREREREIDFKEFAHNSGCLTSFYKQLFLHHDFSPSSQQSWPSSLSSAVDPVLGQWCSYNKTFSFTLHLTRDQVKNWWEMYVV